MGACHSRGGGVDEEGSKHNGGMYLADVNSLSSPFSANLAGYQLGQAFADAYSLSGSKPLGKGAYGTVRTCYRKGSPDVFALKTLDFHDAGFALRETLEDLKNEISILRSLDHPNIVRLFESYTHQANAADKFFLVMECLPGGNLHSRLRDRGEPYNEQLAVRYMRMMLSAVRYCHARGVCHRDIKLENFVFCEPGDDATLKLIDFGLSTPIPDRMETMDESTAVAPTDGSTTSAVVHTGTEEPTTDSDSFTKNAERSLSVSATDLAGQVGTVAFMAPEVLEASGAAYNEACDMWAMGVALYEMLAGHLKRPYTSGPVTHSYAKQLRLIRARRFTVPERPLPLQPLSSPACDLLSALLTRTPERRISATQAFEHLWLQPTDAAHAKGALGAEAMGGGSQVQQDGGAPSVPSSSAVSFTRLASALRAYSELPPLVHLCFNAVAFSIAPCKLHGIAALFSSLDRHGTGCLSKEDVQAALSADPKLSHRAEGECDLEAARIFEAMTSMTVRGDRVRTTVAYSEFVAAMLSSHIPIDDATLKHAFDLLKKAVREERVSVGMFTSPNKGWLSPPFEGGGHSPSPVGRRSHWLRSSEEKQPLESEAQSLGAQPLEGRRSRWMRSSKEMQPLEVQPLGAQPLEAGSLEGRRNHWMSSSKEMTMLQVDLPAVDSTAIIHVAIEGPTPPSLSSPAVLKASKDVKASPLCTAQQGSRKRFSIGRSPPGSHRRSGADQEPPNGGTPPCDRISEPTSVAELDFATFSNLIRRECNRLGSKLV